MNIPKSILDKLNANLHTSENHPLCIIKKTITDYFKSKEKFKDSKFYENMDQRVSIVDNFDLLEIPKDHPSRSKSDTYYFDEKTVLRTHTSAHQNQLLSKGITSFFVVGDVYRKDEIDRYHYPIFHQMEGVHIVPDNVDVEKDLEETLRGLVEYLFPKCEYRFNKDYFPFTNPSFEVEVKYGEKWLEILGCGVIHENIMDRNKLTNKKGWAFGFGLERLAMILFDIPDIRLFWTKDERFLSQFKEGSFNKFKQYPILQPIEKDISFWIPKDQITVIDEKNFKWDNINGFYELIREIFDDLIENVDLYDKFYHKKHEKYSHTFKLKITSPTLDLNSPDKLTKYANQSIELLREKVKTLSVEPR